MTPMFYEKPVPIEPILSDHDGEDKQNMQISSSVKDRERLDDKGSHKGADMSGMKGAPRKKVKVN